MATRDIGHLDAARRSAITHTDATTGIRRWWTTRWVTATGRVVGLAAVVTAIAIGAGTQLGNSPSAIADKGGRATPTVTGQGDVPAAIVSGVADPTSALEYFNSLTGGYRMYQTALQNISAALAAQDFDAVKAGCQQLSNAGQLFKSTLPSPNSRVTFRMQSAVDAIGTASDICMGFGPTSTGADLDHMMSYINNANNDFKTVKQILGLG